MLEVSQVSIGYGATTVVQSVTISLEQGAIGCLLGPSGCGKTTLLRAIAGFEPVRAGRIALQGQTVATPERMLAPQLRDMGMVFQDHALFPHLTVAANVAFGLHRWQADARHDRVQTMLELVGLQGMGARWPHELSGGQQQRVALARALAPQPQVLLMDEPFSSLDTSLRESIAREVRAILKQAQATALMVTHDQHEAFAMADHIGVMDQGQLLQWGTAVQVYSQPATPVVAQFVGEGALLPAQATDHGQWQTALGVLPAQHSHFHRPADHEPAAHGTPRTQVLLRPEHVAVVAQGVPARVLECTFRGSHFVLKLVLDDGHTVMAQAPLTTAYAPSARVALALAPTVTAATVLVAGAQ